MLPPRVAATGEGTLPVLHDHPPLSPGVACSTPSNSPPAQATATHMQDHKKPLHLLVPRAFHQPQNSPLASLIDPATSQCTLSLPKSGNPQLN